MAMGKGFKVSHALSTDRPYSVILEHRNNQNSLLFESQAVAVLSSDEVEGIRRRFTKVIDAYGCLGVLKVNAENTSVLYLVMVTGCTSVGKISDSEIFRITNTAFVLLRNRALDEERIAELRKVFNSGTFYFSWSPTTNPPFDLSLCAQRRLKTGETDNRFFWNRMLHLHLLRYGVDCGQWLVKAMCGSVEMRTVYVGHHQARACVISRVSCERAGTRFNVRGCNDDGHAANYAETEQMIFLHDTVTSYVQTRGSIPLFWEQSGVQVGTHKVKLSRGKDASAPVFDRHMTLIRKRYGKQVLVNLLGNKEGESLLTKMYEHHHSSSNRHKHIPYYHFDYHSTCRGGRTENLSILFHKLTGSVEEFGFFLQKGEDVITEQSGVIRTNCLDCLDRTNCAQTYFGLQVLKKQLQSLQVSDLPQVSRFEELFRQMWVSNGDQVSKIYAGTEALQGKSKLMDGARSVGRTIQNNLMDSSKQEAIDMLLTGTMDSQVKSSARLRHMIPIGFFHAPLNVLNTMFDRWSLYMEKIPLRVSVGTWNVNGGKNFGNIAFKHQPLSDWLLDAPEISRREALVDTTLQDGSSERSSDIFVVGFEEIVDLNASNIVAASTTNQRIWLTEIQKTINRDEQYILVASMQLVGVCLFVFIKPSLAPYVKDVGVDMVKTGLGGATGNKGGVAIRLVVHSSSMCFLCGHFAAGQSQYAERNADYLEICRKITFPGARHLDSHDFIFWCGDFNYRIDLPVEEVKEAIKMQNWPQLLQHDQLKVQQEQSQAFAGFEEGEINFPPTYKYDTFSDDYDTSEKGRIPAWTDRVLFRAPRIGETNTSAAKIAYYGRGNLKTSDHRPVLAVIDIQVLQVNEESRGNVMASVVQDVGPPDGTVIVQSTFLDPSLETSSVFDNDEFVNRICQEFANIGEVILVRFVGDAMWVTFKDGRHALDALSLYNNAEFDGHRMNLSLKTPYWQDNFHKQIQLCVDNTVPMHCNPDIIDDNVAFDMTADGCSYFDEDLGNELNIETVDSQPSSGRASPALEIFAADPDFVTIPSQPPPRPAPPSRPPPPRFPNTVELVQAVTRCTSFEPTAALKTEEILVRSSPLMDSWPSEPMDKFNENDMWSCPPPTIAPPPPPYDAPPPPPTTAPPPPTTAPPPPPPNLSIIETKHSAKPPAIPPRTNVASDVPPLRNSAPVREAPPPPIPARATPQMKVPPIPARVGIEQPIPPPLIPKRNA